MEPFAATHKSLVLRLPSRWSADSEGFGFVERKLRDGARYDDDMARHFEKLLDAKGEDVPVSIAVQATRGNYHESAFL